VQTPLPNGRTIPLGQVATFDFDQEYPLIWRRNHVPALTVQVEVAPGGTPEAVVNALAPVVERLDA
jgi:multidrug efflux pump subunit AcrB